MHFLCGEYQNQFLFFLLNSFKFLLNFDHFLDHSKFQDSCCIFYQSFYQWSSFFTIYNQFMVRKNWNLSEPVIQSMESEYQLNYNYVYFFQGSPQFLQHYSIPIHFLYSSSITKLFRTLSQFVKKGNKIILFDQIFYLVYYFDNNYKSYSLKYNQISMTSLKKNFSMNKLYSDLQKYQANLNSFKESRTRQTSQSSSSLQKKYSKRYEDSRNSQVKNIDRFNKYSNINNTDKSRLELKTKYTRQPRQTYEIEFDKKKPYQSQISYQSSNISNMFEKQNRQQLSRCSKIPKFSQKDEVKFLSECQNIYGVQSQIKNSEQDTVKQLLKQINKRDEVYQLITSRVGCQNTIEAIKTFFQQFQRKKAIIAEFKKMSKLDIEDDRELLQLLQSEQQIAITQRKESFEEEQK